MAFDLRIRFQDGLSSDDPGLENVSQRPVVHEREGLSAFARPQLGLCQDSRATFVKQEVRRLSTVFRSWLEPEKNSKDEMISLLILEQILINSHVSDRPTLKEKWNSSGRNLEKFVEDLPYDGMKTPALVHVHMQGQEALFTENMPLREVISLLREQLSAGTQTKEDIMTASRMFRDAPLETEQGDEHGGGGHVSLIIYGVEDSDVSEGSKTPSLLIMEENCLQLEENSVSLEGELSSRPDPNTSMFRDASPGGLPGQREPDPAEQNVAAESCTQGEQEEEEEENYTVSALHRCEHCPKTFKYPSRLKAHLRKHRNERTYFCKECHKGFFQFSDLREHKKIHSGVRPFSCSMCGVAFTYKTNLQAHERIHTGEKPYMCLSCCKSYRQSSTYHRHLKTHKKNKPVLSGSHQGPGDDADDGASTSRDGDPGFHP